MTTYESFNQSSFSKFLIIGYVYRYHVLGVISMLWGLLPLSAGALDICYVSAALGGPLSGKKIRGEDK
jgi:hypothetical protein